MEEHSFLLHFQLPDTSDNAGNYLYNLSQIGIEASNVCISQQGHISILFERKGNKDSIVKLAAETVLNAIPGAKLAWMKFTEPA